MKSPPYGEALIINNETFLSHSKQMDDRRGSEHDVSKVKQLFEALGFEVTTKENLTKSELMKELDAMACKDHSRYDCFVLWLMSHGDKDVVYGTDGEVVFLETVRELFSNSSCRSLDGKPKVFFIQACRGDREEFVESDKPNPTPRKSPLFSKRCEDANQVSHSRTHFLEAYSTVDGFVSYRNKDSGSYYVKCLFEVFCKRVVHDDVATMLTEVNNLVTQKQGRICFGGREKQVKQTCDYNSSLTKKLYFRWKNGSNYTLM